MRKIILGSLFGILTCTAAQAGVFKFENGTRLEETYKPDEIGNPSLSYINTTDSTIDLRWELLENSFMPDWDYSLCDNGNCYVGVPAANTPSTMAPNEKSFLKLVVNPMNIKGSGTMRFLIYPKNRKDLGDTLTFTVHVEESTGIAKLAKAAYLQAYPNPAAHTLQLNGIGQDGTGQVRIMNAAGQTVLSTQQTIQSGRMTLDVAQLPAAAYWVQVIGTQGDAYRTTFVKE